MRWPASGAPRGAPPSRARLPAGPVEGAAVVGVDQAEEPGLVALVGVGEAGHGGPQHGLGHRDVLARPRDVLGVGLEVGDEAGVHEQLTGEGPHPPLPVQVRVDPGGRDLGLAERLLEVRVEPVGRDGPRAEQGLEEEPALVGRRRAVVDEVLGDLEPPGHVLDEAVGVAGQGGQPGAGVGAALRVVGGGRQHGAGEPLLALEVGPVQLVDGHGEPARVAAHVVEREQPGGPVERRVLHALRDDRWARLLEPGDEPSGAAARLVSRAERAGCRFARSSTARSASWMRPLGHVDVGAVHGQVGQRLGDAVHRRQRAAAARPPGRRWWSPARGGPRAPPRRTGGRRR